jgi:hypothetical protein
MKKLIAGGKETKALKLSLGLGLGASLALAFWFATSPSVLAQDGATCSVCHKRTQTLNFPCNSLEYRRHLDHGDAMGDCPVTPVSNP